MKKYQRLFSAFILATALLLLILDTKTAIDGSIQGIDLCIKTLIPTLFPFLIISILSRELLSGIHFRLIQQLLKPCMLPKGSEMILVLGFLSGYPIGAKLTQEAYTQNQISKTDAQRMLMFCSNAGPSFIFGIVASFFEHSWIPWLMWLIHISSGYIVAIIVAEPPRPFYCAENNMKIRFVDAIPNALKSLSSICGWVIFSRIVLNFLEKWFLHDLPNTIRLLLSGLIELSNGCLQLDCIPSADTRFLIALTMITLGGFCIALQTTAVAPDIPIKYYLKGKFMQSIISLTIAIPLLMIIFPNNHQKSFPILFILLILVLCFSIINSKKKSSSIPKENVV